MKKANNWNAFGFFDDFISRRGYKDYKLILHTLGGFCDLFYLDSSFFFFFFLLFLFFSQLNICLYLFIFTLKVFVTQLIRHLSPSTLLVDCAVLHLYVV